MGQSLQPASIARCGSRPTRRSRACRRACALLRAPSPPIAEGLRVERARRSSPSACSTRRARSCAGPIPLRVVAAGRRRSSHFWGDTHGQSNETLGTNTAREYFEFGRDKAFLDVMGHQGNDFQITGAFWRELNALTRGVRRAGPVRVHPGLRVVGQHGGRRRPQRALPPRGRDHPPLLACPDRRCRRHRRRGRPTRTTRTQLFARLRGQGLRGDGARRRALRRHQVRARPHGDGGRGALGLGHVRVDRCATPSRRTTASASSPTRTGTRAGPAPAIPAPRSSAATAGSPASWPSGSIATPSSSACAAAATTPPPATAPFSSVTAELASDAEVFLRDPAAGPDPLASARGG